MKTLYLLRHAYAETACGLADMDRPLGKRGHKEAKGLAGYVCHTGLQVDYVMCSAAVRTQQTFEPLRPWLGTDDIEISDQFYNISEQDICDYLHLLPDHIVRVLYIGHNPGIGFAMRELARDCPLSLQDEVLPATLIGLQFPCEKWEQVRGEGEVIALFLPRDESQQLPSPEEW